MLWKNFILFLLLLLPLSLVYSELPSPGEMTELEILDELRENLKIRKSLLNQREQNLNERENRLNQREMDLNERETSWTEIHNYWMNYAEDNKKKQKSEFWKGFLFGSGVGFLAGESTGIYFGLKFRL